MYTASGQLMQSSGDFPNGSSEPVYRSDDQVVALPEPAHALGPAGRLLPARPEAVSVNTRSGMTPAAAMTSCC